MPRRLACSRAGVTVAILNGSKRQTFSDATVRRVREAAETLGCTPHAAARALRRGESGIVLLALPDLPASANFAKLLESLTDGVRATGRSLVSLAVRPGNGLRDVLRDLSPVALLEVLPLGQDDRAAAAAVRIPVVSVAAPIRQLDHAAAALQVRHLAGLGHRRLAVVSVEGPGTQPFAVARLRAVRETAAELGLPAPVEAVAGGAAVDAVAALVPHVRDWVAGAEPVTAVACFNDLFAEVVVAAARHCGLGVPGDLSVVGIDDDPFAALPSPSLSTVRYDYTGAGHHIRDRLRHLLEEAPPPQPLSIDALEVVDRESTAPLSHPTSPEGIS